MCKKVASRVSILGRVRGFVTKEAATLVHNALILPLFDYYDIGRTNLLQRDIDRLQRLQNRFARIITRCYRSAEATEQLHWPTLSSRRSYHKARLAVGYFSEHVPYLESGNFDINSCVDGIMIADWRRQRGRVVSVSDSQSTALGFESRLDHHLDLFRGSSEFKSSALLVNCQLVCLRTVGILNNVMFNVNHLFRQLSARPN